jgi:hypothetical protein
MVWLTEWQEVVLAILGGALGAPLLNRGFDGLLSRNTHSAALSLSGAALIYCGVVYACMQWGQ